MKKIKLFALALTAMFSLSAMAETAVFTMSSLFTGSNQSATTADPAATISTTATAGNAKDGKLGSDGQYFQVVLTSRKFSAVTINGYINTTSTDKNWGFQFSTDGGTTWATEVTQANDGNKNAHDIVVGVTIPDDANGFRVIRRAGTSTVVNSITLTLVPNCDDPEATIKADTTLYEGDSYNLGFNSINTEGITLDVKKDGTAAAVDVDFSRTSINNFTFLKAGEFVVTFSQDADGTHCAVEESVTVTVLEKTPVTEVTVAGPETAFVGESVTLTATAEGATQFRWMDADNSVIPGATEATYTFTPDVAGTWKFNCQARNQFNVDGSDNPTWQASEIKFITVTHASGELIKAVLGGGTSATVTGVFGGTFDSNLSSGRYKLDKGKYIGVQLAKGAFQEGDTVLITMTVKGENYPCLFADKDRTNCLFLATDTSQTLTYRIILPAAATGLTSLYLSRDADDATYKWNPTVASISVVRPKFVKSSTETLTGVAIDGVGISAEAFEALIESHNWGTSKEYANAPTVVFTKHVVVTYEDDTTGERDEEVEVVAEDTGSNSFRAEATIGGINYIIITAKSTVYTVVFKDGETEIGSENVEVGQHPTAENIELPAKEFQRFAAWQNDGLQDVALDTLSAAAGETINLYARWEKVYSQSINIEQIVLDEGTAYDIKAAFAAKGIVAVDVDALDTLNDLEKKDNRNYAFLGLKVKKNTSTIAVLLANEATLRVKFGNVGNAVNVKIGDAEPVAKSAEDLAEPFVYTNETGADIVVRFVSSGTKTVVFKQIMINEAIAEVVLPAPSAYAITLEAGEHGTLAANWEGKTDKKVNVPVYANVTLTITPEEGYAIGLVEYEGANVGKIRLYPDEGVYQFTMPEEAVTVSVAFEVAIESVSLGVVFPLVGTEIENKIYGPTDNVAIITVPEGANYELSMYDFWEEGGNVELEGALVENTTYEIRITVEAKAGFAFASNAPILVNGVAADHISNDAEFDRRDFTVSFQPRAIEEITEVAITIPSFPKLNETVGTNSFEASVPDGAGYTIDNRSFFDEENNYLDHDDYVFTAGTYVVELGIFPKTGFAFPNDGTDCADGTKITMTVNGEDPYGWYGAWAFVPVLVLKAQFTLSAPDPTGMGNTEVEGKTVKMIENGQVIIIKNGIRYNALGEMIK